MTKWSPKTVFMSPRMSQVQALNSQVQVQVLQVWQPVVAPVPAAWILPRDKG
jgi:hypothetical protein